METKKLYKTGEFSQMAGVTERTVRYYDKIGLLKPTRKDGETKYRYYSDSDLLKLQKILVLKHLGFSMEDIVLLVNKEGDLLHSFLDQKAIIQNKIEYLSQMKELISQICLQLQHGKTNWEMIRNLVKMSSLETQIADHYRTSHDLSIRISLHDQYSVNPVHWFDWIMDQIDFQGVNRLLEIGCGDGSLWKKKDLSFLRNREVFLTDKSSGMVSTVREELGSDFNCLQAECEAIPFKDNYFDAVVANHVLFYLTDLDKGLKEIKRVLNTAGTFYCSTYGKSHMKEISDLCKEFDDRIVLSKADLHASFGLENGYEKLRPYFSHITLRKYEDKLAVNKAEPIIDYIFSCHGNQLDYLLPNLEQFKAFLNEKLKQGPIEITKDAGLFICS